MSSEPEFYIGYLPSAPPALARFRRRVVAGLLAGAGCVAVFLAAGQRELSRGWFDFLETRPREGLLLERPYPVLIEQGSARLLSGVGKFGAESDVAGLDGRRVRLQGKTIRLGGQEMIEVASGSAVAASDDKAPPPPETDLGATTLEGEIVDSKCYLGVMNPGRGKVHKDCAVRCISGGVPPGFLVRDETGRAVMLTLTDAEGRPLGKDVLPLVGTPLRLRGRLIESGGLTYFRADLSRADRL